MKIILIRVLLIVGILLVIGGIILGINTYSEHRDLQEKMSQFTGEYLPLAQACLEKKESVNCCLSSVSSMQGVEGNIVPPKGCPNGTIVNSLKCTSSYAWCEKKDLKPGEIKGAPPKPIIKYY